MTDKNGKNLEHEGGGRLGCDTCEVQNISTRSADSNAWIHNNHLNGNEHDAIGHAIWLGGRQRKIGDFICQKIM